MKITRFRFAPDRLKKKIYVSKVYFFGPRTLKTFTSDEYEKAMDFIKDIASKNRPSRVTVLDGQGNIRRQWEYQPPTKPRTYETKPRTYK